jgi:uncharacterized membrane protein YgcG
MEFNVIGVVVGIAAFLIIGLLHPVVIKSEYYLGVKVWPAYLIIGLVCVALAFFIPNFAISAIVAVLGFSWLWGIKELFEQRERVQKGWFPANPNKKGADKNGGGGVNGGDGNGDGSSGGGGDGNGGGGGNNGGGE